MDIKTKRISKLPQIEAIGEKTNIIVEENGEAKKIPAVNMGNGLPEGGAPYQQLVTDGQGVEKWEDKSFYEETKTVSFFPETLVNFDIDFSEGIVQANVGSEFDALEAGKTYEVTVNGKSYICTAEGGPIPDSPYETYGIGAPSMHDMTESMPFFIMTHTQWAGDFIIYIRTDLLPNPSTFKIEKIEETIHPLDPKYLSYAEESTGVVYSGTPPFKNQSYTFNVYSLDMPPLDPTATYTVIINGKAYEDMRPIIVDENVDNAYQLDGLSLGAWFGVDSNPDESTIAVLIEEYPNAPEVTIKIKYASEYSVRSGNMVPTLVVTGANYHLGLAGNTSYITEPYPISANMERADVMQILLAGGALNCAFKFYAEDIGLVTIPGAIILSEDVIVCAFSQKIREMDFTAEFGWLPDGTFAMG